MTESERHFSAYNSQEQAAKKMWSVFFTNEKNFSWFKRHKEEISRATLPALSQNATSEEINEAKVDSGLLFFSLGLHGNDPGLPCFKKINIACVPKIIQKYSVNSKTGQINELLIKLISDQLALKKPSIDLVEWNLVAYWSFYFGPAYFSGIQPLCMCSNKVITDFLCYFLNTRVSEASVLKKRQRLGLKPAKIQFRTFSTLKNPDRFRFE